MGINDGKEIDDGRNIDDFGAFVRNVFEDIGAGPKTIMVQNVAIQVGQELKGLYVIGNTPLSFIDESGAMGAAKPGDQIYKVDVYRVK